MLNIRQVREEAALTQLELSVRTGIGRVRMSHLENGYLEPSADEEQKICAAVLMVMESRADEFHRKAAKFRSDEHFGKAIAV